MSDQQKLANQLRIAGRVMAIVAGLVVIALAVMAVHMYQTIEALSGRP